MLAWFEKIGGKIWGKSKKKYNQITRTSQHHEHLNSVSMLAWFAETRGKIQGKSILRGLSGIAPRMS